MRLLLVDDDCSQIYWLEKSFLSVDGHDVYSCYSGKEALEEPLGRSTPWSRISRCLANELRPESSSTRSLEYSSVESLMLISRRSEIERAMIRPSCACSDR
jgi:hypothetical protein